VDKPLKRQANKASKATEENLNCQKQEAVGGSGSGVPAGMGPMESPPTHEAQKHEMASRFNPKYKLDRCPKCSMMSMNFIYVSEALLACYLCGTVFVCKEVRDDFKKNLDKGNVIDHV